MWALMSASFLYSFLGVIPLNYCVLSFNTIWIPIWERLYQKYFLPFFWKQSFLNNLMFIQHLFQYNVRLTGKPDKDFSWLCHVIVGCCMCICTYHSISWTMLVFRQSPKKRRKGFANHFVLLLQFHESRNAGEREEGEGEQEREGERDCEWH